MEGWMGFRSRRNWVTRLGRTQRAYWVRDSAFVCCGNVDGKMMNLFVE